MGEIDNCLVVIEKGITIAIKLTIIAGNSKSTF